MGEPYDRPIDRTAPIDALHPGGVLRTGPVAVSPGSKGVNVARTALRLGAKHALVGFVAGRMGEAAAAMLRDEGVELVGVDVPGELRSTLVLAEPGGRTTIINEPGPAVEPPHWDAYAATVAARVATADALVCSGSVPPGTPPDGYAGLVATARSQDVLAVVDTSGPQLAAGPDLVTPNLAEAEALLTGRSTEQVDAPDDSAERAVVAATALAERGPRLAMVTAAAAGVAVAWPDGRRWLPAPQVTVRNPAGAGDSFTAAATLALLAGAEPLEAAVAGVAAGAAAVERPLAGDLDAHRAAELTEQVRATAGFTIP